MSDAANCICIHGYVSTCPLHGGKTLPNASPPSWKKPPFTECELTITLSEHAAQLQAACVELREKCAGECDRHAAFCKKEADNGGDREHLYVRYQESSWNAKRIRELPIPTAALETALDKTQTETITACASAVCEGCRNNWMLAHGAHQTPHQGEWFPCKADAIWALSPHTIQKSKALFEAAILEMRDRYAKSFASPIREAILSLPLPSTAALETALNDARNEMLRWVTASIEGYPDHGGDIGVMKALETALAEARLKEANQWLRVIPDGDDGRAFEALKRITELQAALDAAKAKELK